MPARRISLVWQHDPTLYAPARYRRACRYEAYVPAPLAELRFALGPSACGVVSDAENAIRALNALAQPALAPLARLLLRTESVASSRVEGLQMSVRELARAAAKVEAGQRVGPAALEVLANIDAMQLAVDTAAHADVFTVEQITAIHARLMAGATNAARTAGKIRDIQNWTGGNDHNPCGADFVPPPPEYVDLLLEDLCAAISCEMLPPLVQPRSCTPSSRRFTRSRAATAVQAARWCRWCSGGAGWRPTTCRRSAWCSPMRRTATSRA